MTRFTRSASCEAAKYRLCHFDECWVDGSEQRAISRSAIHDLSYLSGELSWDSRIGDSLAVSDTLRRVDEVLLTALGNEPSYNLVSVVVHSRVGDVPDSPDPISEGKQALTKTGNSQFMQRRATGGKGRP